MRIIVLGLLCLMSFSISAQEILGQWKSIDDDTGKAKSIVEIYEDNGKLYGKIVKLINPKQDNPLCVACEGENKDKPILGMVIIDGLTKNDDVFDGGSILNPENGKTYKCRLKLDVDTGMLQVRGYVGFFYKTQYWVRIES